MCQVVGKPNTTHVLLEPWWPFCAWWGTLVVWYSSYVRSVGPETILLDLESCSPGANGEIASSFYGPMFPSIKW